MPYGETLAQIEKHLKNGSKCSNGGTNEAEVVAARDAGGAAAMCGGEDRPELTPDELLELLLLPAELLETAMASAGKCCGWAKTPPSGACCA